VLVRLIRAITIVLSIDSARDRRSSSRASTRARVPSPSAIARDDDSRGRVHASSPIVPDRFVDVVVRFYDLSLTHSRDRSQAWARHHRTWR